MIVSQLYFYPSRNLVFLFTYSGHQASKEHPELENGREKRNAQFLGDLAAQQPIFQPDLHRNEDMDYEEPRLRRGLEETASNFAIGQQHIFLTYDKDISPYLIL